MDKNELRCCREKQLKDLSSLATQTPGELVWSSGSNFSPTRTVRDTNERRSESGFFINATFRQRLHEVDVNQMWFSRSYWINVGEKCDRRVFSWRHWTHLRWTTLAASWCNIVWWGSIVGGQSTDLCSQRPGNQSAKTQHHSSFPTSGVLPPAICVWPTFLEFEYLVRLFADDCLSSVDAAEDNNSMSCIEHLMVTVTCSEVQAAHDQCGITQVTTPATPFKNSAASMRQSRRQMNLQFACIIRERCLNTFVFREKIWCWRHTEERSLCFNLSWDFEGFVDVLGAQKWTNGISDSLACVFCWWKPTAFYITKGNWRITEA